MIVTVTDCFYFTQSYHDVHLQGEVVENREQPLLFEQEWLHHQVSYVLGFPSLTMRFTRLLFTGFQFSKLSSPYLVEVKKSLIGTFTSIDGSIHYHRLHISRKIEIKNVGMKMQCH